MGTAFDFEQTFFRRLMLGAKAFLDADPEFSKPSRAKDNEAIIANRAVRLEDHLVSAVKAGMCNSDFEDWQVPCALVDLTQTEQWGRVSVEVMPALLRRTMLYDMVSGRLVGEISAWLAQGFPHPAARGLSPDLQSWCSFGFCQESGQEENTSHSPGAASSTDVGPSDTRVQLTSSDRLELVGNAMNLLQVSAWCVQVFGAITGLR